MRCRGSLQSVAVGSGGLRTSLLCVDQTRDAFTSHLRIYCGFLVQTYLTVRC